MPKLRLKQLRAQHEMTQADVAAILGVSASQYGKIERGASQTDQGNLIKLAQRYDVSLDYLLGLSDERTPLRPAVRDLPALDPVREGILAELARMDGANRRLLWDVAVAIRQNQERRAMQK